MKNFRRQKTGMLLIAIALLLTVAVGGTIAYLAASAGPVTNTFIPGNVPPEVVEEFKGSVKNNVAIKNNGNVDAYIRAKVIFTWQDASGNVYSQLPVTAPAEDPDYTIKWTEAGWVKGSDGFYYHQAAVAPNGNTGVLFTDCKPLKAAPATGYTLHVEVLAQSIQADGVTANGTPAVVDAWGVTMNGTTITGKTTAAN